LTVENSIKSAPPFPEAKFNKNYGEGAQPPSQTPPYWATWERDIYNNNNNNNNKN